jgi:hypothetical protein
VTDAGDHRIRAALRDTSGADPLSRLRDQVERVAAAAKLQRTGSRMEGLSRCALVLRMLTMIHEITADPLATARPEIDEGIEVAERLERALHRLRMFETDVTRDLKELGKAYSEGRLSGGHAAWCDEQAYTFERIVKEIETDDSQGVIEIEEHVKQAEGIRDSVRTMRGHPGGDPGPREATPEEEVEKALAALGLPRRPVPDWPTIMRRCNALRKEHNTDDPDHRATKKQELANNLRMQEINTAMDCLKKHKAKLADMV